MEERKNEERYGRVPPLRYVCEGFGAPEVKIITGCSRRVDNPPVLGYDPTVTLLEGAERAGEDGLERGLGITEVTRRRTAYYVDNVRVF